MKEVNHIVMEIGGPDNGSAYIANFHWEIRWWKSPLNWLLYKIGRKVPYYIPTCDVCEIPIPRIRLHFFARYLDVSKSGDILCRDHQPEDSRDR